MYHYEVVSLTIYGGAEMAYEKDIGFRMDPDLWWKALLLAKKLMTVMGHRPRLGFNSFGWKKKTGWFHVCYIKVAFWRGDRLRRGAYFKITSCNCLKLKAEKICTSILNKYEYARDIFIF